MKIKKYPPLAHSQSYLSAIPSSIHGHGVFTTRIIHHWLHWRKEGRNENKKQLLRNENKIYSQLQWHELMKRKKKENKLPTP